MTAARTTDSGFLGNTLPKHGLGGDSFKNPIEKSGNLGIFSVASSRPCRIHLEHRNASVPLISNSHFRPPWWLRGGHLQTLWPAVGRRVPFDPYQRERLELIDGDFLDLDWSRSASAPASRLSQRNNRVVIVSHGLEGNSQRTYIRGCVRALNRRGWDVVAWNFRGCSGEPNRLPRAYHSGEIEDLSAVIAHVINKGAYERVALAGFSLGGNMTLRLLGALGGHAKSHRIFGAVVFSVPCDLKSAAEKMSRRSAQPYLKSFLRTMNRKAALTAARFPECFPRQLSEQEWLKIRTFREFDDQFTAPLHGFRDAEDYWATSSSKLILGQITVPTLILNARNDPFLAPSCFPFADAILSPAVWLEVPADGGHVGFCPAGDQTEYWHETRAAEFLERLR